MERLIPDGAYFKHTTRRLLSPAEKERLAVVAERSVEHLISQCQNIPLEFDDIQDFPDALRSLGRRGRLMDRAIPFLKGETQPRRLYRRARRRDIATEAARIATETGANFSQVYNAFLERMESYVSDEP